MTVPAPGTGPAHRSRLSDWFAPRHRRAAAGIATVVVAAAVAIGVADPFSATGQSNAGTHDNSYPTSTTTVVKRDLSSQTSVSATLGYAASYPVAIPAGSDAATISQAAATVRADESALADDESALAQARSSARPTNASTLLAAHAAVSSDTAALSEARHQLAADERLSCPASSSSTVTSAVTPASVPSSSPSSASASHGGSTGSTSTGSSSTSSATAAGDTGDASPHVALEADALQPMVGSGDSGAAAPSANTGAVDQTTSTSATLTGTVNPTGADTTYVFQYGTSPNFGQTTASADAGSSTANVSVSAVLSDLRPGATYNYRLVATNSLGTSYGQDASFTTSAAPSATTGTATTVSATSESLSGTVDPNGAETTYHFEWGTTSSYGHVTSATDIGAGSGADSVSATVTGLRPDTTYVFALVATSPLGTSAGIPMTFATATSSCIAQQQVVTADAAALSEANDALTVDELGENATVVADEHQLASDRASATAAAQALAEDKTQATNPATTFTTLPALGKVITRGEGVYSLDGRPVPLFYGTATLYRALYLGVGDGPDVAELQANLIALGFGAGLRASGDFTPATAAAVRAWQASLGVAPTGVVALGDLVVEPGPIEVDAVSAADGAAASPGTAVLTATSTTREVTIALDAAQQSEVRVGDPVTVTLPDNSTTPGVVSLVGTVATTPSSGGGGNTGGASSPTITVEVTLTDPRAAGDLDQAPVEVAITNASVKNALVVPVDALLALAGGGYALEEIGAGGVHHYVAVNLGLFDDADGLVQVTGAGVAAGQSIVVPNT